MAVLLAFVFLGGEQILGEGRRLIPTLTDSPSAWASILIFGIVIYLLAFAPLKAMKRGGLPSTPVE